MPTVIIGHKEKYNMFSTISDGCYFEEGATEDELREWYQAEYGKSSMAEFENRLKRCKEKGTSSQIDPDLESVICCNRAGKDEAFVPYEEFIKKYL